MAQLWQVVIYAANLMIAASSSNGPRTTIVATASFQAKFVGTAMGREVRICIDGRKVETTFAGKMIFQDSSSRWASVCADVRTPISAGHTVWVRGIKSSKVGGNIQRAGNIVARFFNEAQSPDECAALQIAVWKAIEDGGDQADFSSGHFQVQANKNVMSLAATYYEAIGTPGEASFIKPSMVAQAQLTT